MVWRCGSKKEACIQLLRCVCDVKVEDRILKEYKKSEGKFFSKLTFPDLCSNSELLVAAVQFNTGMRVALLEKLEWPIALQNQFQQCWDDCGVRSFTEKKGAAGERMADWLHATQKYATAVADKLASHAPSIVLQALAYAWGENVGSQVLNDWPKGF